MTCASIVNRSSVTFYQWQLLYKYATYIPINLPDAPDALPIPYETLLIPFIRGTTDPASVDFNNLASYNYAGRHAHRRPEGTVAQQRAGR